MTVPYYVNEHQSDIRAIKPGWYGMENNGNLSSGPFLSQGKCLNGEHARSCTRIDGYGRREWIANCCESCGHKLSLEEIGRHIVH